MGGRGGRGGRDREALPPPPPSLTRNKTNKTRDHGTGAEYVTQGGHLAQCVRGTENRRSGPTKHPRYYFRNPSFILF